MNSFVANFNSESFWRSEQLAKLPAFADDEADKIVGVMDEMQFVFAESSKDVVITRLPMNSDHMSYLEEIGMQFSNKATPLEDQEHVDIHHFRANVFELLYNASERSNEKEQTTQLSPFAVLPYTDRFQSIRQFQNSLPDVDVVIKVNSKEFSHIVTKDIFGSAIGTMVYTANELLEQGRKLLKEGSFLVKDVFGVSGKGNLKVDSDLTLQRIVKHLSKQEMSGKKTCFLIEPFLDKAVDFCCQFHIDERGRTTIVSANEFQNTLFSFSGSQKINRDFNDVLTSKGYFETVEKIGNRLFKEGYFGDVCIDSMMLTDGSIVPIVEINARKSMSLINHYMDKHLYSKYGKSGTMHSFSFNIPGHIRFKDLFNQLKEQKVLFEENSVRGVVPLSANTFEINGLYANGKATSGYRGKFYVSVVGDNIEDKDEVLRSMNTCFSALDLALI